MTEPSQFMFGAQRRPREDRGLVNLPSKFAAASEPSRPKTNCRTGNCNQMSRWIGERLRPKIHLPMPDAPRRTIRAASGIISEYKNLPTRAFVAGAVSAENYQLDPRLGQIRRAGALRQASAQKGDEQKVRALLTGTTIHLALAAIDYRRVYKAQAVRYTKTRNPPFPRLPVCILHLCEFPADFAFGEVSSPKPLFMLVFLRVASLSRPVWQIWLMADSAVSNDLPNGNWPGAAPKSSKHNAAGLMPAAPMNSRNSSGSRLC